MRICYIADAGSIHTQRWINYFAEKGHEIHLISLRAGQGYAKGVQLYRLVRLMPHIWPVTRYFSGLLWLVQARRLVRRIKPDILDAHTITVNSHLAIASGFHPLVLTAWGSDILIQPKKNPFWRALTKYALRKAELIVYNSEIAKKGLLELGAHPSKLRQIFNGVDTQQFNPYQRDKHFKRSLQLPEAPIVICIRSLRPLYNVEMLIKAIPSILKQVPQVTFIIGGDGEQRDYLKDLAGSLGILGNVRFLGWIQHDELPRYLASSDVYVSTSLSDSAPLSLQEAMACELAPVVTDLPANREWIVDGENGFLVSTGDIQALAQKIVHLLKNQRVRRRFGKLGREIIQERAEYKKEMGKLESVYKELV